MKQFFAIFCAFVLLPMFTTQAWVGGPFSNNNALGNNADDGVYEAVASTINGLGLFRIVVGNDFIGSQDIPTSPSTLFLTDDQGNLIATVSTPGFNSGNVVIGAFGTASNTWYYRGVFYSGTTLGTANSALGIVQATANATDGNNEAINSAFRARFDRGSKLLPASAFSGTGRATGPDGRFRFTVFGTKVSQEIFFGI
ncbi:MAG: hypothetical protein CMO55_15335 [Verrucomicrobiales bacterium]|nr:hypothetical protein [Verrucomicrobiales bacterium]